MKVYGPEIAELVASIVAHSRLGHDKYTRFMDLGGLSALLQLVVCANVKVGLRYVAGANDACLC